MKTLKLIKSSGVIFVTAGIITVIAESIGVIKVSALGVNFSLLPMLYAVIIGVLVTPDLIGKYIRPLGNILNHDAIKNRKHSDDIIITTRGKIRHLGWPQCF